ncbi:MAG: polyprenyl synthetase family protein, partial [Lachnospiraceae bacterium]|nr:polyprenyl synthetase family protein [Lachnospiraceae bacterium]
PIHSDEKNKKVTYITLYGMQQAEKEVERLSKEAISVLESVDGDTSFLVELVTYLIHRKG